MHDTKKITVLLITVLMVALLFVTCRRLNRSEVVEIKAVKASQQEPDKVISAVQEKKEEPITIIIESPDTAESARKEEKVSEFTINTASEDSAEENAVTEEVVEESVADTTVAETIEEHVEVTVDSTVEETSEITVSETVETNETVEAVEIVETTKTDIAETVETTEETTSETVVENASEDTSELFNPPVKAKEIPIKKKKNYGIGMEIGFGAGYYRLEYNDYKADMFKISIPVYLCFAQNDRFSISAYVKPGYLKELKKDAESSPLIVDYSVKKQDYCFECGVGLNSYSNRFSLRTNLGLDFFNPGTKINNPHTMLNLQIVPSFRLGGSKLWLSLPFEGSISLENKDSRAYGAGIYITLRTDEIKK